MGTSKRRTSLEDVDRKSTGKCLSLDPITKCVGTSRGDFFQEHVDNKLMKNVREALSTKQVLFSLP